MENLVKKFTKSSLALPLIALALLLLFNALFVDNFFKIEIMQNGNLYGRPIDILYRASSLIILALGMTFVIATGGIDISVLTGFVLGAASHRMVVVFDNAITGAAVLAAQAVNPLVREYVFPSSVYDELIHQAQCRYLGVKPYLHYGLNIDEGLGATMGLSLIDASMHMLNDMKTFVEADVHAADNGPGNERQVNKN